jgi:hypothetical protein
MAAECSAPELLDGVHEGFGVRCRRILPHFHGASLSHGIGIAERIRHNRLANITGLHQSFAQSENDALDRYGLPVDAVNLALGIHSNDSHSVDKQDGATLPRL